MEKDDANEIEKLFNKHYIIKVCYKISGKPYVNALAIALPFHLLYIILVFSIGQISSGFLSRMHLLQSSFSLCIFVGILLLQKFHFKIIDILKELKNNIKEINDDQYKNFLNRISSLYSSSKSIFLSLPLIIISLGYFYGVIYPNIHIPNGFFSIPLLFHYFSIEFSLFMLYLLGSVGFWFMLVVIILYVEIAKEFHIKYISLWKPSFKKLFELPSVIAKYLLTIEICVLPIIVYIVYFYSSNNLLGGYLGTTSLIAVVLLIMISYLIMHYYLSVSVIRSKTARMNEIIYDIEQCELSINLALKSNNTNNLKDLILYHEYLIKMREDVKKDVFKDKKFAKFLSTLMPLILTGKSFPFLGKIWGLILKNFN